MNTAVYVFTDFISMSKMPRISQLNESDEKHIDYFAQSKESQELHDFTGHPVQFDWRIYLGRTTTKILQEIKKIMEEKLPLHRSFKEGSTS